MSGGLFLTPRNLWNLSVQSSSIAIMATGMVLIIVSRNIDLSVGSLLGLPGLHDGDGPGRSGSRRNPFSTWLIAIVARRSSLGALIGGLQGFIVAYGKVPGVHRHPGRLPGLARPPVRVRTRARRSRRWTARSSCSAAARPARSASGRAGSSASLACVGIVYTPDRTAGASAAATASRCGPMWAEVTVAVAAVRAVLGVVCGRQQLLAGRSRWPAVRRRPQHHRAAGRPARSRPASPFPVLIMIVVTLVMTYHRHAPPLRALRLRDRRQSGGGRARRHQRPPDDRRGRTS